MAVIWRVCRNDVVYEVRGRGHTMRLYANGVQHSEYHPQRWVTGSVWDLLWLPVLFYPPGHFQRVLVLGLGGGTLIPPLRGLLGDVSIHAVELDPVHLEVARDVFAIGDDQLSMECADARDWVANWQGEPFDLIIEDLFAPVDRTVTRAIPASRDWFAQLQNLLTPSGTLVMNFGDWAEYRQSPVASSRCRKSWKGAFRFATPDCHNAVVAWLRQPGDARQLRQRIRDHRRLSRALEQGRLDYSVRRLF